MSAERNKRKKFPSMFDSKTSEKDLQGIYRLMDFLNISHPKLVPEYKIRKKSKKKEENSLPVITLQSKKEKLDEVLVSSVVKINKDL